MPSIRRAKGYSGLHIALHWIIAALIVAQLLTSDMMSDYFRALLRAPEGRPVMGGAVWHAVGGGLVVLLTVVRLAVRMTHGVPPDSPASEAWDRLLSRIVHFGIYVLLFAMPLSGLAAYLLPSRAMGELHESLKWVLIGLIVLHIMGAFYHHFLLKDGLIRRMMVPDRGAEPR